MPLKTDKNVQTVCEQIIAACKRYTDAYPERQQHWYSFHKHTHQLTAFRLRDDIARLKDEQDTQLSEVIRMAHAPLSRIQQGDLRTWVGAVLYDCFDSVSTAQLQERTRVYTHASAAFVAVADLRDDAIDQVGDMLKQLPTAVVKAHAGV